MTGTWRTRSLVALCLVLAGTSGYCAWSQRATERTWRELESKAQALKADIDAHFPAGSPQSQVGAFLSKRVGDVNLSEGDSSYWVRVGKAPNRDWKLLCGPWEVGVEVTFDAARLVSTTATARGVDCI